jgi:hypothetical protein
MREPAQLNMVTTQWVKWRSKVRSNDNTFQDGGDTQFQSAELRDVCGGFDKEMAG